MVAFLGVAATAAAHAADAPSAPAYTITGDEITIHFGATDADMAILDTLPELKRIAFDDSDLENVDPKKLKWAITDAGFRHIANCRQLESFTISCIHPMNLTDHAFAALEGLPALRTVDLSFQQFPDAAIAHLAQTKSIRNLTLSYNKAAGDGVLATAAALPNLRTLDLYGVPVTDAGIAKIRGLTELTDLQLGNSAITDSSLKVIATFAKLHLLDLAGTHITDAGMVQLKPLQLHWLSLSGTGITSKGLAAIDGMSSLEWLIADNTPLDDPAMETVVKFKNLESLGISGTHVTDAGIATLARLEHLRLLKVNKLPLTDTSVDGLLKWKSLKSIEMNGTKITAAGEKRLAAAGIQLDNKN